VLLPPSGFTDEPYVAGPKVGDGAFVQKFNQETVRWVGQLALLTSYLHEGPTALRDYRYVPGLRSDDAEGLILIYVKRPSRRTWHGDTHWFRADKRWVVLNPRMSSPSEGDARGWSECGEAICGTQFKTRLRATLDYLKSKERPSWQAAREEHLGFLSAIKE